MCSSKTAEEKALEERNRAAELLLKRARKAKGNEIKLLLLGTGESGKSTFAKQMRILHDTYTEAEKLEFTSQLHANTLGAMKTLVLASRHFRYELQPENVAKAARFVQLNPRVDSTLDAAWVQLIRELWKDPGIHKTYKRRNELQLLDSTRYLFSNMKRFIEPDFVPSEDDVLRARSRTVGIVETTFDVDEYVFRLVDVGGQRSERRRWIHTFEDVTAVLFFAALTDYDQALYEAQDTNRMLESINLWEEIVGSAWFHRSAFILFLNKSDLFEEKIARSPLSALFEDYVGGADVEGGMDFIREQYLACDVRRRAKIFPHYTTATDTSNITHVFEDVRKTIVSHNLESMGFGAVV